MFEGEFNPPRDLVYVEHRFALIRQRERGKCRVLSTQLVNFAERPGSWVPVAIGARIAVNSDLGISGARSFSCPLCSALKLGRWSQTQQTLNATGWTLQEENSKVTSGDPAETSCCFDHRIENPSMPIGRHQLHRFQHESASYDDCGHQPRTRGITQAKNESQQRKSAEVFDPKTRDHRPIFDWGERCVGDKH